MFYCINYFINFEQVITCTSILLEKIEECSILSPTNVSSFQKPDKFHVISTFEKNSIHIDLLIDEFVEWFDKFIIEYRFNSLNFAFINYNDYFSINKLGNLLITHYSNINIPEVYYYYYSINQLFINTYGFNNKISIKSMKRFLRLQIDEYYVKNIEANYLLYIFIRIINDYGERINSLKPTFIL